jgi:hypothetical protein
MAKIHRRIFGELVFWLHSCATGMRDRCHAGGGFVFFWGIGSALGVENGGRLRGMTPRLSGDETVEQHGEDRLIGGAGRQVDLDLGFQFDDAGGEFDQAQPQGLGMTRRIDHKSQ